jgi:hypothetical protein
LKKVASRVHSELGMSEGFLMSIGSLRVSMDTSRA